MRNLGLGLVFTLGCGSAGAVDVAPGGSGGTGGVPAEPTPSTPSGVGSSGGSSPIFMDDMPSTAPPKRCDKVDFLFVVDNSASMADKQDKLARSFAGFNQITEETLGTNDYQIMVIDTDDDNSEDFPLDDKDCAGRLGAGRRTSSACYGPPSEESVGYLISDEQSSLAEQFACLARVGVFGDVDERPAEALLSATGAIDNDLDTCNRGFLRDDAVLVVTIITDEEDDQSSGDPDSWRRQLLAVKNGNEQSIVMLGLIADRQVPGGLPGGPCDLDSVEAPRLQRFVESFERGSLGSVCAPDYASFFAQAVSEIDTACQEFVPIVR
jgi:hypothetical protein